MNAYEYFYMNIKHYEYTEKIFKSSFFKKKIILEFWNKLIIFLILKKISNT